VCALFLCLLVKMADVPELAGEKNARNLGYPAGACFVIFRILFLVLLHELVGFDLVVILVTQWSVSFVGTYGGNNLLIEKLVKTLRLLDVNKS
jgi:hypothetical protein